VQANRGYFQGGCSLQRAGCRQLQWCFGWPKAPAPAVICIA